MKIATTIARLLLGLVFTVFAVNFFFPFLPMPEMPERAKALAGAMYMSGYLFHAAKLIELTGGLLLLAGVCVPLALTLLGPIVVNIALFNLFLTPPGEWGPAILVTVLEVFLIWAYRNYFCALFTVRATPA